MFYTRSVRVLACSAVVTLALLAQQSPYVPYQQKLPEGVVDWDSGWIRADVSVPLQAGLPPAQAKVNAQRVAIMKAQAAALRIAMNLPVNSEERLEAFEAIKMRVKGVVAGGQVISEGLEGRNYRLSLKVPVNGVKGIVAEVSKVTLPPEPAPEPETQAKNTKQATAPPPAKEHQATASSGEPSALASFASVTVDARDADVRPALQPRILDEKGEEVYGAKTVKPLVAREKTLARYVAPASGEEAHPTSWPSPESLGPLPLALITPPWELLAQREPTGRQRGGTQSLEVKAVSASGTLKADIVVTEETAKRLREAEAASGVLSDAKVVVIVRPDVGGVESRRLPSGDTGVILTSLR